MINPNTLYRKSKLCDPALFSYLNSRNANLSQVFCKTCYTRSFFTGRGRNRFGDSRRGSNTNFSDRDGCAKCHGQVYEVDKVGTK